jgi:prepilin-type processing-associated H-X9-DG protein
MKQSSFTLTELIVVISIIALLIAILVPVLQSSRQQAKAILCGSNIKQLESGLFMYETQNQMFPYGLNNDPELSEEPPGGHITFSNSGTGWWWFNFIEDFYKKSNENKTVIQCPSKRLTIPKLKNNILCGNYGVNRSICKSFNGRDCYKKEFVGVPLRTIDIRRPGETLLIVDSGYTIVSWWHATDTPPVILDNKIIEDTAYVPGLWINKRRNLWLGQEEDAIYGRHPQKTVNIGFVDGHVNRTKADDLFVEKTDDSYKNKTPLWTPK